MKNVSRLFRFVPLAVLVLGLTACTKSTEVSTKAAGHAITAKLEGTHSLDTQADRAVIAGEFGKVTVEAARVRIGEGKWISIPEQVPVALGITKHKRWITAGGVSVKESGY